METTGTIGVILGLYWDNGNENGNYRELMAAAGGRQLGEIAAVAGLGCSQGQGSQGTIYA